MNMMTDGRLGGINDDNAANYKHKNSSSNTYIYSYLSLFNQTCRE